MFSNIYIIKNKVNNKLYVGQTTNVEKRWKEHKYHGIHDENTSIYLYNAMKKYGIDNFTIEVIEKDIPLDQINDKETYWIKKLNTLKPNGYNLTLGGEGTKGYIMSEDTKHLISEKAKERYSGMSEEEKLEMISRLPKDGYDLDKMNEGYKNWLINATKTVKEESYKKAVKTKKEKRYDFYNFSFGKMSKEEKVEMYIKISKSNPRSQAVLMIGKNNKIIKEFHSIGDASRYLNKEFNITLGSKNRIRKVLDTDYSAYGYMWKRK